MTRPKCNFKIRLRDFPKVDYVFRIIFFPPLDRLAYFQVKISLSVGRVLVIPTL